jgi:hypothetical protein
MSARKTNMTIMIIGLIGVILLGVMMWYMRDKVDLGAYTEVAAAVSESCPINGTNLSIEPAFDENGEDGVDVVCFPSAGILGLPDSDLKIEAERVALYVYEEANSAAANARKGMNTFDGLNSGAPYRKIADGFVNVTMKSRGGLFGCSEREEHRFAITRPDIFNRTSAWFAELAAKRPDVLGKARFDYRLPRKDKPGTLTIYPPAGSSAISESEGAAIAGEASRIWKFGVGKVIFIEPDGKRREIAAPSGK